MTHPYEAIPDHCHWSRAVTWAAPGQVNPFVGSIGLLPTDRIATMGSCFAQHLAREIQRLGYQYFVTEPAPAEMTAADAHAQNYGVFSARYGNVYTVRQALQLFDRAFGSFAPAEDVWAHNDRFVDAFRPQIQPGGYASPEEVRDARQRHLESVRRVFLESDWLAFTLGLTEAWRALDGAVFPSAPGVAGGDYDPARHEFVNFSVDEVRADLFGFVERCLSANPKLKLILTVSPVPLIATYEPRHVLVSTTASKAILRVAADEAERRFPQVTYFPAYEIITANNISNQYYDDTLRGVTELGVAHVMRTFGRSLSGSERAQPSRPPVEAMAPTSDIVCDEELIERAIRAAAGSST